MNVEPTSTLQRRMNAFNPLLSSTPAHGDPPPKLPPVATPSPGTPPIPPFTFGHLSNTIVASASVEELSTVSEDKPSQDFKKTSTLSIPSKTSSLKSSMERIIIGGETESVISHRNNSSKYSSEVLKKIDGKSREVVSTTVLKFIFVSFTPLLRQAPLLPKKKYATMHWTIKVSQLIVPDLGSIRAVNKRLSGSDRDKNRF
ncbi:hypothetical protein J6590_070082 [Homalodisca vitripennis]|nr:hypothetical protein J6590_070082 [Homalodisca vitripennis]